MIKKKEKKKKRKRVWDVEKFFDDNLDYINIISVKK